MDYTHTAYFPGAPPYQFMGSAIPPLTPSHSNSVASDEFNTTSPPVGSAPAFITTQDEMLRTAWRERAEEGKREMLQKEMRVAFLYP
jgi:hypothetical protein